MEKIEWEEEDLKSTIIYHGFGLCCVTGCHDHDITYDTREPNGRYKGISYCPKHAEMLKEAQWKHQRGE